MLLGRDLRGRPGAAAARHDRRRRAAPRGRAPSCACPRACYVDPGDIDIERRDDETMIINMGPAAPVDPRRAAPHARARRRDGAAHQADHRLPAHRHGEDGRGADLRPGRRPTSPAWTTCRRCTTSWCSRWPPRPCSAWRCRRGRRGSACCMVELNRVSSHLMWMATNGMDLGSTSMMIYGFREREMVLAFFEKTTGLRMNHNFIRPGRRGGRPARRLGGRRRRSSATPCWPAPTSTTSC